MINVSFVKSHKHQQCLPILFLAILDETIWIHLGPVGRQLQDGNWNGTGPFSISTLKPS